MRKVGEVTAIWRYPVSSLRGEQLDSATLLPSGIAGDRIVGLFDAAALEVASPDSKKRWRSALQIESRRVGTKVEIRAPGDSWRDVDRPDAAQAASAVLGFAVAFHQFGAPVGGRGVLASPRYERGGVHVLTTASLRALAAHLVDAGDVDTRRFRPNLVVDTVAGLDGFCERDWIGSTLAVGEARVAIARPCERCSFVALAQAEQRFAPAVLHAIARHGGGGFGVLGEVETGATVSVGAAVYLETS